jgi:hypothetical protein
MAILNIPAPNALMMCGDSDKIAMHGKKVAVFPDWWTERKVFTSVTTGRFGELDLSSSGNGWVTWRCPLEPEPKIDETPTPQFAKLVMPPIYIAQRKRGELDADFLAFVELCEGIYGVEFKVDETPNGGALAEAVDEGGFQCEKVVDGYVVSVCNITSLANDGDSLARGSQSSLEDAFGEGAYALALAFRKPESRLYKDSDGFWNDKYRYPNNFGVSGDYECRVCGYGIYNLDGESLDAGDVSIYTRVILNYRTISRANPTIYSSNTYGTYAHVGWGSDDGWRTSGWTSPSGVLDGIKGSPVSVTTRTA